MYISLPFLSINNSNIMLLSYTLSLLWFYLNGILIIRISIISFSFIVLRIILFLIGILFLLTGHYVIGFLYIGYS